jgi:Flp pilus assembly protein TadG
MRPLRAKRAQALVEFALVVPVMLVFLLGTIDLGRGLVFGVAVQHGAREAARVGAGAALDSTVTDTVIVERLIAASAPALVGCLAVLNTQQTCGGGRWVCSVKLTFSSGTRTYASLAEARDGASEQLSGARLEVTIRGSVSLLADLLPLGLGQISVQGQSVMVVM